LRVLRHEASEARIAGAERIAPIDVEHAIDPARVRAHEVIDLRGSPDRITATVGWRAEIPLRQRMADTLAWWESQLRAGVP
jgi:GDP-4-dehydro-6-deoxy-D-mannose reductase